MPLLPAEKVFQGRHEKGGHVHIMFALHTKTRPSCICIFAAVQNERDHISCRRPSFEDSLNGSGDSIVSLMTAEVYYREVRAFPLPSHVSSVQCPVLPQQTSNAMPYNNIARHVNEKKRQSGGRERVKPL